MSPDTLNHALTMWDVAGELDAAVMESAFLHVLDEAEVLRVTFTDDGSGLRLTPRELGDWRPFHLDVSADTDPEQAARTALADLLRTPFDLERDLLFRLGVVKLAASRSLVVIAYHHLVSDGFGTGGLLSKRLAEVYTALARGQQVPELPHPWDVESFAAETEQYTDSPTFTEDTAFWRDYLADAPPPAQVPRIALPEATRTALAAPTCDADRWGELTEPIGMVSRTLTVPRAEADTWTDAAQTLGVWMSTMLTSAAAVYFRHRCDRPDFLLSLAVGNRVGVASRTPGLAVNVVPVRVRVPLGATFTEIADAMVDETYELFGHTACHYSDIQRASDTAPGDRGSFGAVMNVVDFVEQLHFADSPARYLGGTTGAFDELSIAVYNDGTADSDLYLRLDAPTRLYSRAELHFIGAELIDHVRALVAADDRPVGALDVLSGAERDRVLTMPPTTDTTATPTPGELFAHQVRRAPDAVALVSGDSTVSYRELDERSDRVADALRRQHVGPETVVAVALPRSVDLAVALLGVVKTGGAHLPIDPALPAPLIAARIGDGDTPARALLTDTTTAGTLPDGLPVPVLLLDALPPDHDDAPRPPVPPRPDHLLAVLPDDPTTPGGATGVAVTHGNLTHHVTDRHWQDAARGTVLWHAPHTSDTLALDLWAPLLNGGRVVVAPPGDLDVDALTRARAAHDITAVWLPAGLFTTIAAQRPDHLAGLHTVWTGGDRVPAAALRRVQEACPGLTTVDTNAPTAETALYVLGPGLAPVPVGVTGELYVAGPAVPRGCPGSPARTAERFVPCPFGPAGALMRRTGDRVRRDADGRLTHVGRTDAHIDVRGVRVEPAEVEEALAEHTGLAQSVVVARDDASGQHRLVAYVVPALSGAPAEPARLAEEMRRFAAARLPEPMVPTVITVLDRLPMTSDGRVDRAALPQPAFDDGTYRAPRNDTERALAAAFADVLELDRVGIDEDFFDLGGNSLRAIRLVGLIRTELNQEVSIRRLFAARTVIALSDMWQDLARSSRPTLRRRTKEGAVL
ncbi:AMP-binding protein [Streptomyces longispororuber]|nr:AMP-binding protein [Streptomyces longispororuber]